MTYLENPQVVKGTKMAFAGLKKAEDTQAVIAYIEANGAAGCKPARPLLGHLLPGRAGAIAPRA